VRSPNGTATIKDVARRAGVAVGTVSNYLNRTAPVAEKTAQRVKRAIDRLGFRIHMGARSLRSRRTYSAGLVLPNISNPFYAEIARAVEHALWEKGVQTFLCDSSQDAEREWLHLESLASRRVDGILLIRSERGTPSARVEELGLPVVYVDRAVEGKHSVTSDNRLGGELAARHLAALGHRRVGVLAGESGVRNVRQRLRGFTVELERNRVAVRERDLLKGPQALELGYRVDELLKRSDAPTAIFATNDIVAIGAWRKFVEIGVRVPEDVSLMGFDDIEMSRLLIPPLTTVRQDKVALGREAAELLLSVLGGDRRPAQQMLIPPQLVVRESTAAARGEGEVRAKASEGRPAHLIERGRSRESP
jgi:LacI family transcriptional regulator